jgi:hypothetical protein
MTRRCRQCREDFSPGRPPQRLCDGCLDARRVVLPAGAGEATGVPPGPGKVDVLAARYAAGQPLWHRGDAKGDAR